MVLPVWLSVKEEVDTYERGNRTNVYFSIFRSVESLDIGKYPKYG